MRKTRWIGVLAFVALGCGACGGEAPQVPAGPSSTGVPSAATQAATISTTLSDSIFRTTRSNISYLYK